MKYEVGQKYWYVSIPVYDYPTVMKVTIKKIDDNLLTLVPLKIYINQGTHKVGLYTNKYDGDGEFHCSNTGNYMDEFLFESLNDVVKKYDFMVRLFEH